MPLPSPCCCRWEAPRRKPRGRAQTSAQATAQEPAAQAPGALDTVQVTAQRRGENIQDVPMAITTIDREKLEVLTSGGEDIRLLSGRCPA